MTSDMTPWQWIVKIDPFVTIKSISSWMFVSFYVATLSTDVNLKCIRPWNVAAKMLLEKNPTKTAGMWIISQLQCSSLACKLLNLFLSCTYVLLFLAYSARKCWKMTLLDMFMSFQP